MWRILRYFEQCQTCQARQHKCWRNRTMVKCSILKNLEFTMWSKFISFEQMEKMESRVLMKTFFWQNIKLLESGFGLIIILIIILFLTAFLSWSIQAPKCWIKPGNMIKIVRRPPWLVPGVASFIIMYVLRPIASRKNNFSKEFSARQLLFLEK